MSEALAKRIEAVRERVRRNEPSHRDPERFHIEKSELTQELTFIAEILRLSRPGTIRDGVSQAVIRERQARRARRVR